MTFNSKIEMNVFEVRTFTAHTNEGQKVFLIEVQDQSDHSCGASDLVSCWADNTPLHKKDTHTAWLREGEEDDLAEEIENGATCIYLFKEKPDPPHHRHPGEGRGPASGD
jgi:hypothetical protein